MLLWALLVPTPEQMNLKISYFAEIFRSAAEAGPLDILKLYNKKGNLIKISPSLAQNDPSDRYKLEAVAPHCPGMLTHGRL